MASALTFADWRFNLRFLQHRTGGAVEWNHAVMPLMEKNANSADVERVLIFPSPTAGKGTKNEEQR